MSERTVSDALARASELREDTPEMRVLLERLAPEYYDSVLLAEEVERLRNLMEEPPASRTYSRDEIYDDDQKIRDL